MSFEITNEILNYASDCELRFACLECNSERLCNVAKRNHNGSNIIECLFEKHCDYKLNYGDVNVCNCAVRREIYFRYGR